MARFLMWGFALIFAFAIIEDTYAAKFTTHTYKDTETQYIIMNGGTQSGDDWRLRNAYNSIRDSGQEEKIHLWLNGPGGEEQAMKSMIETMADMDLVTLVDDDDTCFSACAVIWTHGKKRAMGKTANIGFHVASLVINPESAQELEKFKDAYGWVQIQIHMQLTFRDSIMDYYALPISDPAALVKGIMEDGWTAEEFFMITEQNAERIIGDVSILD